MKLDDVKIGMKVGFTYKSEKFIGVVKEITKTRDLRTDDFVFYASVETSDRIVEVNIKKLIGLL